MAPMELALEGMVDILMTIQLYEIEQFKISLFEATYLRLGQS